MGSSSLGAVVMAGYSNGGTPPVDFVFEAALDTFLTNAGPRRILANLSPRRLLTHHG